jgi:hypothetical protein
VYPQVSTRTGQDNLAMSAIRFLTTVARSVHHTLFQGPGVLQQVCEAIVLPNLKVSAAEGCQRTAAAVNCVACLLAAVMRGVGFVQDGCA